MDKKNIFYLSYFISFNFITNFIIIFIFCSLPVKIKNSEIRLVIQGSGSQKVINKNFANTPNEVLVNGNSITPCKICVLPSGSKNIVTLKFNSQLTTCSNMFMGLTKITEIDLSDFDSSKSLSMYNMFNGCTNLKKITFGNMVTSSVRDMEAMFKQCSSLTFIDLSKFDTRSVTTMREMFKECRKLISVDVSNFNTKNVEDMMDFCCDCNELITIDVSNFVTTKATNLRAMFAYCRKLLYLDMKKFNGYLATDYQYMFDSCEFVYLNMKFFQVNKINNIENHNTSPYKLKYFCIDDTGTKDKLSINSDTLDCSNICFRSNIKIDTSTKECVTSCANKGYRYEFNNICNVCPSGTYKISKNNMITLLKLKIFQKIII